MLSRSKEKDGDSDSYEDIATNDGENKNKAVFEVEHGPLHYT